jgi:uncharacterized membrane protein YhaH (DUF805 family)
MKNCFELLFSSVKNAFCYEGRATRKEFWLWILASYIVNFVLMIIVGIGSAIHEFVGGLFALVMLVVAVIEIIVLISLAVRRMHDINLSGFWLLYLLPFGLPLIYAVYLLGVDSSCTRFVEKHKEVGSPWLGWILTWLFWYAGAPLAQLLLFIYAGRKEDNEFGPNPYV